MWILKSISSSHTFQAVHANDLMLRLSLRRTAALCSRLPLQSFRSASYERFASRGHFFDARTRRTWLRTGGLCALVCGTVYVTHLEPVPGIERKALQLFSRKSLQQLSEAEWSAMQAQFGKLILPPHSSETRRVRRIVVRLLEALPKAGLGKLKDLEGLQWRVSVVESNQLNAFCLPNGRVVVFTGLLRLVGSDDELAAVLAHELSHVICNHGGEKASTQMLSTIPKVFVELGLGLGGMGGLLDVLQLPFSRRAELEADAVGLKILAAACYMPRAAASLFQKLEAATKHAPQLPSWLSTHPANADRIAALSAQQPKALQRYSELGCSAMYHQH
jgi:Zn-dependent protease with chaperone function